MSRADSTLNAQILDEAAEWFVALRHADGEVVAHDRFMDWLRTSPEHVRAYLGIVGVWSDLPSVDGLREADVKALISRSRAVDNVVPIAELAQEDTAAAAPVSVRRRAFAYPRAIAAAILVASIGLALVLGNALHRTDRYSTGIGEQRILNLQDGSRVELNSRSRIRVRYSESERRVELIAGQVLFDVAKDSRRPFRVLSDSVQMRALGTKFDVYRKARGTTVTVVEGKVAIGAASKPEHEIVLGAGEAVVVTPRAPLQPIRADVTAATAWTQGQLFFKAEPLSIVVEEFNRHNRQQIVLADSVEDFPVTAVFSSVDPRMLVEFLKGQPGFDTHATRDEIRVVAAARSSAPSVPAKKGAPNSSRSPL